MKTNQQFSRDFAEVAVSYTRFSLIPWCLLYLYQRKYNSWPKAVTGYGFLVSALQFGHVIGQQRPGGDVVNSFLYISAFGVLVISYVLICFVDAFVWLLLLFFNVGWSGSILSGVSLNVDRLGSLGPFVTKREQKENGTEELPVIVFCFSTLFSGFIYDSKPYSRFPMRNQCILLVAFLAGIILYFNFLSKFLARKSTVASNSTAQTGLSTSGRQRSTITYDGPIPSNFLAYYNNNESRARESYIKMLEWRQETNMDRMFDTPQPHFHDILRFYPHAIHGYSTDGCAVVYELLGRGSVRELRNRGITIDQIVWHFALRNELVFERLLDPAYVQKMCQKYPNSITLADPTKPRRMMTILDVKGIGMNAVSTDVLNFITKSGFLIDNYYPLQVARLVIVNTPSWFSLIFSAIKPALPSAVQNKIYILQELRDLDQFIHPSQRPREYGGTDVDLGQAEGHLEFMKLEENWRLAPAAPSPVQRADSRDVEETTKGGKDKGTAGVARKNGMLGWLQSRMWRSSVAAQAHLGESNNMYFDPASGRWIETPQDDTPVYSASGGGNGKLSIRTGSRDFNEANKEEPSSAKGRGPPAIFRASSRDVAAGDVENGMKRSVSSVNMRLTMERVDELAVINAIHAAHNARGTGRDSYGNLSAAAAASPITVNDLSSSSAGTTASKESTYVSKWTAPSKVPAEIFLVVISSYVLLNYVFTGVCTLIPVWLTGSCAHGGLYYNIQQFGMLLSTTGILLAGMHHVGKARLVQLLKTSPVRTLRLACAALLVLSFLIPLLMHQHIWVSHEEHLHEEALHAPLAASGRVVKVFHEEVIVNPLIVLDKRSVTMSSRSHDHEDFMDLPHVHKLSNVSIMVLCLHSALLASLLAVLFTLRKASQILLQLALSDSVTDIHYIRLVTNAFIETTGPILAAFIYCEIYGAGLPYPLDSSGFLALAACTVVPVYIGSMLVRVQFRGDYGVMYDVEDIVPSSTTLQSSGGISRLGTSLSTDSMDAYGSGGGTQMRPRGLRRTPSMEKLHGDDKSTTPNSGASVLSVPLNDIQLLFSASSDGYGGMRFNVHDAGFKDL